MILFRRKINLFLVSLLLLTSCGEKFQANKETFYVRSDEKEWLVDVSIEDYFQLTDSLSNAELFTLENEWSGFNSEIYSTGFDKEITDYQTIGQRFKSDRANYFSISLEAKEPPQGTILRVNLKRIQYDYDLKYQKLISLSAMDDSKHISFWDNRYQEFQEDGIGSKVEYLDSLEINNQLYTSLLLFRLNDFLDQWVDSTIVVIVIAKNIGLVQYSMNNGIRIIRLN